MPAPTDRTSIKVASERAILAALHLPQSRFDPNDPLGELASLASTAGAEVVGELVQNRRKPESGSFLGRGKLEELRDMCKATNATMVLFDNDLTPSQIGAIEEVVERKVIDRSELILDIFASRATTHEAMIQVELAQLEYTYPRLRAMWSHLERIVGVGGVAGIGVRGPGEQQLELDRRIVQRRKTRLQRQLAEIQAQKRRLVQKRNQDHFTVGLVGYTNAGKSTLFNTLTAGGAYADDRLFATLMTRTRKWSVQSGLSVMLSDTVGFVRDLPHNLIASFKATLEETMRADLLLIVLDVSDPAADLQYETVTQTLDDLFNESTQKKSDDNNDGDNQARSSPHRLLVLNKVDALRDNSQLLVWSKRDPNALPICAVDPQPCELERLQSAVLRHLKGPIRELLITLELRQAKTIHAIESRGEVLDRTYGDGSVTLRVRIGDRQLAQLQAMGASLRVEPAPNTTPASPSIEETAEEERTTGDLAPP